jgi:hypothetical protein
VDESITTLIANITFALINSRPKPGVHLYRIKSFAPALGYMFDSLCPFQIIFYHLFGKDLGSTILAESKIDLALIQTLFFRDLKNLSLIL